MHSCQSWYRTLSGFVVGLILVTLVYSAAGVNIASADILADFLFDQLMENSGPGALDHLIDYREQRQLWKDKIAEGKAKLERCGNCADRAKIEKELAKWRQTEAQFQEFAGAVFVAVGMPRNIAKFLDIDMPMAPHDSEAIKRQYEVVKPEWAKDRPDYCQVAVDSHLQCLRDFQKRTGSPMTEVAKTPGGACYDTRKLFVHCANKNYQAFQMEKNLHALRAAGKIIPEYVNMGQYLEVYYGPVPDNFVPSLPPEVVLAKFKEDRSSGIIRLTTRKKGIGVVGFVSIQSFFWNGVVPSSNCFSGQKPRNEIERRICDDLSTLSFKERLPILSCRYTEPGLMPSDPFAGSLYWYGSRAAYVDPKRLLSRAANHPVLSVGEARTQCPLTRREAEQTKTEWIAKVARLRAETPQIDEKIALPESEWRKQQREEYEKRFGTGRDKKAPENASGTGTQSSSRSGTPESAPGAPSGRLEEKDPGLSSYIEAVKAFGAGDYERARELYDQACKAGHRSACLRVRAMQKTGQPGPQESKRTPEIIAKPRDIPPVVGTPPADGGAPRKRCIPEEIAGTYQTVYGPLVCKAGNGTLDCCYGASCEKKAKLRFDESGQNMIGTWSYPDGRQGVLTFPVSQQCALQSGRWGDAGKTPNRPWTVGRR